MKKYILLILMVATIFAVGCGSDDAKDSDDTTEAGKVEQNDDSADRIFDELDDLEFCFSSGAGAWGTVLTIDEDGSFEGGYSDINMGETGEGYPKGTCYICEFSGQFTEIVKVNDYTYSMKIADIKYDNEPGTSEIDDGIMYEYTTPHGIDNAKEILLYLPGAPISELPEEYIGWVNMNLSSENQTELPFYGLYNVSEGEGFFSYKAEDNE